MAFCGDVLQASAASLCPTLILPPTSRMSSLLKPPNPWFNTPHQAVRRVSSRLTRLNAKLDGP